LLPQHLQQSKKGVQKLRVERTEGRGAPWTRPSSRVLFPAPPSSCASGILGRGVESFDWYGKWEERTNTLTEVADLRQGPAVISHQRNSQEAKAVRACCCVLPDAYSIPDRFLALLPLRGPPVHIKFPLELQQKLANGSAAILRKFQHEPGKRASRAEHCLWVEMSGGLVSQTPQPPQLQDLLQPTARAAACHSCRNQSRRATDAAASSAAAFTSRETSSSISAATATMSIRSLGSSCGPSSQRTRACCCWAAGASGLCASFTNAAKCTPAHEASFQPMRARPVALIFASAPDSQCSRLRQLCLW